VPAKANGDYSNFPEGIQSTLPVIEGELCEFMHYWSTFSRLFMEDRSRTEMYQARIGGVLGEMKPLITEKLILILSRMTDKDGQYKNVSMWRLLDLTGEADFDSAIKGRLDKIYKLVKCVRMYRDKILVHNSLDLHEGNVELPFVCYKQLAEVGRELSDLLNVFHVKYGNGDINYDPMSGSDVTEAVEETIKKAKALEYYEKTGAVPRNGWRLLDD